VLRVSVALRTSAFHAAADVMAPAFYIAGMDVMPDKLPMKQGFAFLQRTVPFDGKWFFARRG
jgi:hypothetical protein